MKKNILFEIIDNEDGFLLVLSLMILSIVSIFCLSTSDTTRFELTIAANERVNNLSFYSAESARSYVEASSDLFNDANSYDGSQTFFPTDDPLVFEELGELQTFSGDVAYQGGIAPPRGSGYEANTFMAHTYDMTCNGNGPQDAISVIKARFYRIGFKI